MIPSHRKSGAVAVLYMSAPNLQGCFPCLYNLPRMQQLPCIIFDFDGVIADSFDMIYSLSERNAEPFTHEDFLAHHDGNVWERPRVIFSKESMRVQLTEYRERLTASHIEQAITPITKLYAQNYRLFINSSNYGPALEALLQAASIDHCFEKVMGYEPEPSKVRKFELLAENHGVDLHNAVFVTDTLGDILEAHKLGIRTIAETFGFHNRERLAQGNPYAIVDSWEEILEEINKLSHRDKK